MGAGSQAPIQTPACSQQNRVCPRPKSRGIDGSLWSRQAKAGSTAGWKPGAPPESVGPFGRKQAAVNRANHKYAKQMLSDISLSRFGRSCGSPAVTKARQLCGSIRSRQKYGGYAARPAQLLQFHQSSCTKGGNLVHRFLCTARPKVPQEFRLAFRRRAPEPRILRPLPQSPTRGDDPAAAPSAFERAGYRGNTPSPGKIT